MPVKANLNMSNYQTNIQQINASATPGISRRPARNSDIPFLIDLRRQTMSAYLIASGIEPTVAALENRVMARFECAEIIVNNDNAAGLLKVARDGKEWTLIQIQLVPSLQGKGIGSMLIREIIDESRQAGAKLKLSVLKTNPALGLYKRLGFLIVKEREHAYEMLLAKQNSS